MVSLMTAPQNPPVTSWYTLIFFIINEARLAEEVVGVEGTYATGPYVGLCNAIAILKEGGVCLVFLFFLLPALNRTSQTVELDFVSGFCV